jgi:hypothetical protein
MDKRLERRGLVFSRQKAFVETIQRASDALSLQCGQGQALRQGYNR